MDSGRHRQRGFRPFNTLSSPTKPTFAAQDGAQSFLDHSDVSTSPSTFCYSPDMVKERDPSGTCSGQYTSPTKQDRQPLANISTKMQSPSPKQSEKDDPIAMPPKAPAPHAEFGKASPMRNPLRKQEPSLFIPKKPSPPQRQRQQQAFMSSAARQAQAQAGAGDALAGMRPPMEHRPFHRPGQATFLSRPAPASTSSAGPVPQGYGQRSMPGGAQHGAYPSNGPPGFYVPKPVNPAPVTS